MLPIRWKIFRVLSYVHMAITALITALGVVAIFGPGFSVRSVEQVVVLFLMLLAPVSLLANSSVNILLLERYYPDRLPGKTLRRFSVVLFILTLLSVLFVLLIAAVGLVDTLSQTSEQRDIFSLLAAAATAVIGLTGAYVLWFQVSLRKAIRRNHELVFDNFLKAEEFPQ